VNNTFNPVLTSFVFSPFYSLPGQESGSWLSLIIVFVPRILVGIVPWLFYMGVKKVTGGKFLPVNWALSGVVGSMTNTLLVMHMIFIFFGEDWYYARGGTTAVYAAILGIIATNGVMEAIVAGILVAALMGALTAAFRVRHS